MSDFINNFANQIINGGLSTRWTMRGCWGYEIRDLENHYEVKLPTIYKDFLKKMGKGDGKFMQGTDMFYRGLFYNREAIEDVLELEKYPFHLEKDIFVFLSHQGYIFNFFNTVEDKFDPPVYGYKEGDLKFKLINESFSDFLQTSLDEEVEGWNLKT